MICIIQRDKGVRTIRSHYELYHINFAFLVIHVITEYVREVDEYIPKVDLHYRNTSHVLK